MKRLLFLFPIVLLIVSCANRNNFYHAEHEDGFDLKQSKQIIEHQKTHKAKNDKKARRNQEKIQEDLNAKNQNTSKTKVRRKTDTSFRFY